jgi:hypothetical protein
MIILNLLVHTLLVGSLILIQSMKWSIETRKQMLLRKGWCLTWRDGGFYNVMLILSSFIVT